MRRPRDIGTEAERAVVRYLCLNGWPSAERRALRGAHDAGDITGTPGLCWEVKGGRAAENASDGQVADWLAETIREARNANADWPILVLKRRGYGTARAGMWWAITPLSAWPGFAEGLPAQVADAIPVRVTLDELCEVLYPAGYGTDPEPTRAGARVQAFIREREQE